MTFLGVARVVAKIREIGLSVAGNKTEALWFHGLRRGVEPPCMSVRVGDADIEVGRCMRYLGLVLDSRWRFDEHFDRLVPRIHKVAGALHKLLPNLGTRDRGRKSAASTQASCALSRSTVRPAILPNFRAWLKRKKRVTYRLTQVLTGHGCFGEYLHRIGREASARCHHCGHAQDSAQHTLEECPAWQPERQILVQHIGPDLSPENVVAAMHGPMGTNAQWLYLFLTFAKHSLFLPRKIKPTKVLLCNLENE
ncbi:uncharacterized protein [Epargyreus clarus]|uniref:uncharacterized protein n=1 Tax=Epargyreus clarus TaxID=520877 RepID=UPI003C2F0B62